MFVLSRLRSRYFIFLITVLVIYITLFCLLHDRDPGSHSLDSTLFGHIWKYHSEKEDLVENCGQKYGIEMFHSWESTKFEICTNESLSQITCFLRYDEAGTRQLCLLSKTKIRLHEPHYVASTSDPASLATIVMDNDIVSADCEPLATSNNGRNERMMQFDSLFHVDKFNASRMRDFQCSNVVKHTVFWMWRWDATNAYHFLEDMTNTFSSLILLGEDPNEVEIAIYDGLGGIVNYPLFTLWSELFPKGVRIIRNDPFPRNTCFDQSIISMYGSRSHFTEFGGYKADTHCSSPILKGFRSWAIERLQIERTVPVKRTLILVSRQQYLSTRNISRVLVNEDVIVKTIKTTFPSFEVIVFRPENYGTFKEQVAIAARGNIMVGLHGAGLVYSLFMSPGSHLIEIFMDDRTSVNRHYHNIASWMDLEYHSTEFFGKVIPPEQIVNVIHIAVNDLNKMSTAALKRS